MQVTVLITYIINSSNYIHKLTLNIYKQNQHLYS